MFVMQHESVCLGGTLHTILVCHPHSSLLNPFRTLLLDHTQSRELYCLVHPSEIIIDYEAATMSPEQSKHEEVEAFMP